MASEAYAAACCNNKVFLSVVVSLLLPGSNPPRSLLPLLPWSSGWYARLASGRIGITLLPDGGNRGNRVGPLGAGPSAIELLLSSILVVLVNLGVDILQGVLDPRIDARDEEAA